MPGKRRLDVAAQRVLHAAAVTFGGERSCSSAAVNRSMTFIGPPHQKSYELFANHGCFAREICDKCGIVLGAVRFTRRGESEVYCSRECRGDAHRAATRRPGRPHKYKTARERRAAKTRQQQAYRVAS